MWGTAGLSRSETRVVHFNPAYVFYPVFFTIVILFVCLCFQVKFYKSENRELSQTLYSRNAAIERLTRERMEHINRIDQLEQELGYYTSMYETLVPGETVYDVPVPRVRIADSVDSIAVYGLPPTVFQARVAGTRSMAPTLTEGMIVLLDAHVEVEDLQAGDIIAFKNPENPDINIIHRIIFIGQDDAGWYCLTKGDNPHCGVDGWKLRFQNIIAVYVGNIG